MGIQKIILNIVLTIEKFFLQFFKIKKNRIVFISLTQDVLTLDFKLIYNQLDKEKYDVKLCLIKYKKDLIGQFLYFLNCMKQMYYVYTSRIIILNDNNFVVSNYKRDNTIVIQTWHACGAIKKFGNATSRQYPISNYDYILSSSSYWKGPYSEAFGVNEENVLNIGMARTDKLFDIKRNIRYREQIYSKYPELRNKKVILYAPTFRGNIYKGFTTVPFDAKKIIESLDDEYVLLYKFHPLLGNIQLEEHERIYNMNHISTYKLFCISDALISDYSSIVFDYMIFDKKLLFYVPDLEEYTEDLGVFVDIKELGYPICMNEDEIIQNIKSYPVSNETHLENRNKFIEFQDGKNVERIIKFIEDIM